MAGCRGLSSTTTFGGETRGELGGSLAPLLLACRPAISSAPELLNVSSEGGVAGVRGGDAGETGEAARLRSRRCCGLNHSGDMALRVSTRSWSSVTRHDARPSEPSEPPPPPHDERLSL